MIKRYQPEQVLADMGRFARQMLLEESPIEFSTLRAMKDVLQGQIEIVRQAIIDHGSAFTAARRQPGMLRKVDATFETAHDALLSCLEDVARDLSILWVEHSPRKGVVTSRLARDGDMIDMDIARPVLEKIATARDGYGARPGLSDELVCDLGIERDDSLSFVAKACATEILQHERRQSEGDFADVSAQEWELLRLVKLHPGESVRRLTPAGMSRNTASPMMKDLEARGLIENRGSANKGQWHLVRPLPAKPR